MGGHVVHAGGGDGVQQAQHAPGLPVHVHVALRLRAARRAPAAHVCAWEGHPNYHSPGKGLIKVKAQIRTLNRHGSCAPAPCCSTPAMTLPASRYLVRLLRQCR